MFFSGMALTVGGTLNTHTLHYTNHFQFIVLFGVLFLSSIHSFFFKYPLMTYASLDNSLDTINLSQGLCTVGRCPFHYLKKLID